MNHTGKKPHEDDDREAYEEKKPWDERGDNYITTPEVDFLGKTDNAVHIEWRDKITHRRHDAWIPRRLLHYNTDKKIDTLKYGQKFNITCFEWIAKEKELPE